MKFKCGRTTAEKLAHVEYLKNWHPWFAWFPITLGEGNCRWLEVVQRRFPDAHRSTYSGRVHRGYTGSEVEFGQD